MNTLILTQSQIRSLIAMDRVVAAVEQAFAVYARGKAQMPAKVYLSLPEYNGDFRAMPAYLDGWAGVKWVNSHPDNPARFRLPSVMGMYILSNPANAHPLAVMDATLLTAMRTGAAGAVASKYLAVTQPGSVGFIGCGVQARVLLDAHRAVYGDDAIAAMELRMADAHTGTAEAFAGEAGGKVTTLEQAAACDIVCTTTPSRSPVVQAGWVKQGAHINAMGADGPGKQELDPGLLTGNKVVIDDREQAHHSGEINVPLAQGLLSEDDVHATLGEVVAGLQAGREGDEITIFDSTGLAIQDVAVARLIYELALDSGVGTEASFLE